MSHPASVEAHWFPRFLFWASVIASVVLIGSTAFFWNIVEILTEFLAPTYLLVVWGVFLTIAVLSLGAIPATIKAKRWRGLAPFGINLTAFLIVCTVPFTAIMIDLDFHLFFKQRMEIVEMVESGELEPDASGRLIALPHGYRHLSQGGGDIVVEYQEDETLIFFFTYRGILDNFSGFMYRSQDSQPQNGDMGGDFFQVEKYREQWYWVAAS